MPLSNGFLSRIRKTVKDKDNFFEDVNGVSLVFAEKDARTLGIEFLVFNGDIKKNVIIEELKKTLREQESIPSAHTPPDFQFEWKKKEKQTVFLLKSSSPVFIITMLLHEMMISVTKANELLEELKSNIRYNEKINRKGERDYEQYSVDNKKNVLKTAENSPSSSPRQSLIFADDENGALKNLRLKAKSQNNKSLIGALRSRLNDFVKGNKKSVVPDNADVLHHDDEHPPLDSKLTVKPSSENNNTNSNTSHR